jgi:hypothetical protein
LFSYVFIESSLPDLLNALINSPIASLFYIKSGAALSAMPPLDLPVECRSFFELLFKSIA